MSQLGVDARVHMPKDSDGRRVTARSKGKVERPFRTVKEAHETLYHFHQPENEAEAMTWLINACAVDGVGIDDILEPSPIPSCQNRSIASRPPL